MTDNDAAAARARGQALRIARVARARSIRRRVISAAIALFVAAWLMIAIVLVSGHDPALASHTSTASAGTTVASNPTTNTATTSSSGSSGSSGSSVVQSSGSSSSGSSSSGSSGGGVSSVATSQS